MKEEVILKNGVRETGNFLMSTMVVLTLLGKIQPALLAELSKKCHDPNHEIPANLLEELVRCELVDDDGNVSDRVRNVVLAAVTVKGNEVILDDNPVLEPA